MNRDAEPANRLAELPETTRKFLAGLRDDELDTLRVLVDLPADDVKRGFELFRRAETVGKFFKWLIVGAIALFLGIITLWEGIIRFVELVKGVRP